jgi:hypothetical protein
MASVQEWKLGTGTARVYPAGDSGIRRPVILAAPAGASATDLAAFEAGVDHSSYSLLAALRAQNLDLILLGFNDGDARLGYLADAVKECVHAALGNRNGDAPLVVGGIGRGALAARYALAKMEAERDFHATATYFSYNGTAPTPEEAHSVQEVGDWPMQARLLGMVSGDFTSELVIAPLEESPFDDAMAGARNPGGPLITKELGSWLLDRLTS